MWQTTKTGKMIANSTVYPTHAIKSQVHCSCPAPKSFFSLLQCFLLSCIFSLPPTKMSLYSLFSLLDTRCPSWGWLRTHENPVAVRTHCTPPPNRRKELQCLPWKKKKKRGKNAKACVGSVQNLCGKGSHKESWNP